MAVDSRGLIIGPHLPYGKGLLSMVKAAVELEANTFQFYTRNLRAAPVTPPESEEIAHSQHLWKSKKFFPPVAHAPYSLNPASPHAETRDFAVKVITEDLQRIEQIGCSYLVLHPGFALEETEDEALKHLADSLSRVFENVPAGVMVLLETMSGTGAEIGYTPEHFVSVMERVRGSDRLGICLDTGHLYASGELLVERPQRIIRRLRQLLGPTAVRLCHLNDSAYPQGSRQDRHAKFGLGQIALTGFLDLFRSELLDGLPLILESPCDRVPHFWAEIKNVRQLAKVAEG